MTRSGDWLSSDGGAFNPYDYAVAAVRISARFRVGNTGALVATIAGPTLSGPFEWTTGAFPGGSGSSGGGLSFCSTSLAPKSECLVSVSFTGQTSGTGQLTLPLANAYRTRATRTMSGSSGSKDRALLTLSATTVPGEVILEGPFLQRAASLD